MTTTIPNPQIYRAAADVIRENGWYQGWYYDQRSGKPPAKSPVCALGAVHVALFGDPVEHAQSVEPVMDWLMGVHRASVEESSAQFVDDWNDEPGTTAADVLALFDRAASAAESAIAAQDGGAGRG